MNSTPRDWAEPEPVKRRLALHVVIAFAAGFALGVLIVVPFAMMGLTYIFLGGK